MIVKKLFYHFNEDDHFCQVYHTDKERFYSGVVFILAGLKNKERVAVLEDEEIRDFLSEFIDVERCIAKGQLIFLDTDRYSKNGFDWKKLISDLENLEANSEKFRRLRVLVNFGLLYPDPKEIFEYELKIEEWRGGKGIVFCMFDGEKFDYTTLTKILLIHSKIVVREGVFENLIRHPPEIFLEGGKIEEEVYSTLLKRLKELYELKKELERIQEQYKAIYDLLQDGVLILKDEILVGANQRSLEMLRYELKEVLGKKLYELSPLKQPDGRKSMEKTLEMIDAAMERGVLLFEWRFLRGDGSFIDVEMSISRFKLNGEFHFICLMRDVTERKRLEKRLQLYKEVFERSPSGIAIIDKDGRYIQQNEAHKKLLGYTDEDLRGKTPEIHMGEQFSRVFKELMEKGVFRGEIEIFRKDGSKVYVDLTAFALKNEKGDVECYVGIKRDVTGQRKLFEKLEKTEKEHRLILENAQDIVVTINGDGKITYTNPAVERILGFTPEEVIGKPFSEFVHPEDLDYIKGLFHTTEKEKLPSEVVCRVRTKNGEWKLLESRGMPVMEDGEFIRSISILRDITELKRIERLLRVINEINNLIVYEKDPKRLFEEAVRLIASLRDYSVWIGFKEGEHIFRVTSHPSTYPDKISSGIPCFKEAEKGAMIFRKEEKSEKCPFHDLSNFSSLILPMKVDGETLGFMIIHSALKFNEEEIRLLQTLSNDLAFAYKAIELEQAKSKAYKQIEKNIEEFAILVDQIRNPLSIISGTAEMRVEDEEARKVILEGVRRIEELVKKLDKGWLESENVRKFLKKYM